MEVRIDSPDGIVPPPNTFLSVRVGEKQMQSRLEQSRTFKFPQAQPQGDRIVARFEVFKRIGTHSVDLQKVKPGSRVEVCCNDLECNSIPLCLDVTNLEKARPPSQGKKVRNKQRLDAAQQYLLDFRLEESLAEAVREVIRDKPTDPYKYLSEFILQLGETKAFKEQTMRVPLSPAKEATVPWVSQELVLPTNVQAKPPAVQAVLPFRSYYQSNFSIAFQVAGVPSLQKAFPGFAQTKAKASEPVTQAVVKADASLPSGSGTQDSQTVGSWLQKDVIQNDDVPLAVKLINFLKTQGSPGVSPQGSYRGPPPEHPAATATAQLPQKPQKPMTPIVKGSQALLQGLRSGEVGKIVDKMEEPSFQCKPSVGTWLTPRPVEPARESVTQAQASESTSAGVSAAVPESPFRHKPSVGSWLSKKPPQVERPWFLKEVDVGKHQGYVRGLQQVISDKDAELERLKAQIAALTSPTAAAGAMQLEVARPNTAVRLASKDKLLLAAQDGSLLKGAQEQAKALKSELRSGALVGLLKGANDGTLMKACAEASALQ
jgi:hypothetical protein